MIGVGAVVAVVAGKVDVVNAGNEFTKSQGPLLGIAFHVLHRKTALTSWGVHPIGEFGSRRNITFIKYDQNFYSALDLDLLLRWRLRARLSCWLRK